MKSSICCLGFSLLFFSYSRPSINSLIRLFPLRTCPIQFFCRLVIVFINDLFSPTLFKISSLFIWSCHLIHSIFLHNHISNASSFLTLFCFNVHVSHAYNVTLHTVVLTILFFYSRLKFLISSIFLLLNDSFPIAILLSISLSHFPVWSSNLYAT